MVLTDLLIGTSEALIVLNTELLPVCRL